jgi:hypothetical protein
MTAVEFLINELSKSKYFQRVLNEINDNSTTERDVLKEALELEKQQIIDAHGLIAKLQEDGSHKLISGETYYNETYKNNDNA